jgi:NitT/TauT family transport system substrate-binding protein
MKAKINKKFAVWAVAIILIVLIVTSAFFYLNTSNSGKLESITIGNVNGIPYGLLYVAQNQSYFNQNSLNVTFPTYASPLASLNALINGNIDVAICSEYPVVTQAFKNANISIIATINQFNTVYIIARSDKGIVNASDLIDKTIGVNAGTAPQFYLSRFLSSNNIPQQDVNIVYFPPSVSLSNEVSDLANGTIDAVVNDVTTIALAQAEIGSNNIVAFPAQVGQSAFMSMVCRNDWITNNTQTINHLLKALSQAETYTVNYPTETQSIIENKLNLTVASNLWLNYQFSLSLSQSLITAMQDEAQWMITNQLTNQTQIPQFTNYVYTAGLMAVKPQSVTIIK